MSSLRVKLQPLTKRKTWNALAAHFNQVRHLHLSDLFAQDPTRGERMTLESGGLYLDYSKNRITNETLKLLFELATESGLRERIDAMFRGDKINATENRAVLHVALRAPKDSNILVDGKNVVPEVHQVLKRMAERLAPLWRGIWFRPSSGRSTARLTDTCDGLRKSPL